eukprot:3174377-Pleurochrysis_carterae.AAC.1
MYPPRLDGMHPIGGYDLRGANCHGRGDHDLYGAPRHIRVLYWKQSSLALQLLEELVHLNLSVTQKHIALWAIVAELWDDTANEE